MQASRGGGGGGAKRRSQGVFQADAVRPVRAAVAAPLLGNRAGYLFTVSGTLHPIVIHT